MLDAARQCCIAEGYRLDISLNCLLPHMVGNLAADYDLGAAREERQHEQTTKHIAKCCAMWYD